MQYASGDHSAVHRRAVPLARQHHVPCDLDPTALKLDQHCTQPLRVPCRYYARGIFAGPAMTKLDGYRGKAYGTAQTIKGYLWGATTLLTSFMDWPLRRMSGGKVAATTYAVRSATQTYDRTLSRELWDASAELAKLPASPQV